jgi:hypothetical protein
MQNDGDFVDVILMYSPQCGQNKYRHILTSCAFSYAFSLRALKMLTA